MKNLLISFHEVFMTFILNKRTVITVTQNLSTFLKWTSHCCFRTYLKVLVVCKHYAELQINGWSLLIVSFECLRLLNC